jgi:filamentous hemagglutinin family protein
MKNKIPFLLLSFGALYANPSDPRVMAGVADFAAEGNRLTVQAADRTVIEWGDFSIGSDEIAHFNLPSNGSRVLNRVVGANSTSLRGQLSSNGQVILINPNGIVFGADCVVRTASLIASTLDVHQGKFLEGGVLCFQKNGSSGSILNEGNIEAEQDLFLISSQIQNKGHLKGSRVEIAAGDEVWVQPDQEQALWIKSSAEALAIGIDQSGTIDAHRIALMAEGAYEWAINQEGIVKARCLEEKEGRILLTSQTGKIRAGGEIDGSNESGVGASLHLLGKEVFVPETAFLKTEGTKGGGEILIGGDVQGKNRAISNSQVSIVAKGAKIQSSCIEAGNAGKVVIWSDGLTFCEGTIEAKGGPLGGDGGFVEVSGRENLHFSSIADRTAPFGKAGELLLDPSDIDITMAANSANVSFAANTYTITAALPSPANIQNTDIAANLLLGPVTITTSSPFADAGNITITGAANSIAIPGAFGLTIHADNDLILTGANIFSGGGASIDIQVGNDLSLTSTGLDSSVIASTGGNVTVQAGRDILLTNAGAITTEVFIGVALGPTQTFVTAGRDIILNNQSMATSANSTAIGAFNTLQLNAGRDVTLINPSFLLSALGPIDVFAGRNVTIPNSSGFFVASPTATITVVVDNQAPTAPSIGDGGLFIAPFGTIGTAPSGPIPPFPAPSNVRLFTARRSQNSIANVNFITFTPGTTLENTSREIFGVWYPSGIPITSPDRFIIFYKEHGEPPFVATTVGATFDTLQVYQYRHPLTLYEDVSRFCVRVKEGDQESESWYPIFLENYREWIRSASPLP